MIPGVLDLNEKPFSIVNCTMEPITLHAKQPIGVCESYIDSEVKRFNQVNETAPLYSQKPASAHLPDHLQNLFNSNSVHLDASQREVLKNLSLTTRKVLQNLQMTSTTLTYSNIINTDSAIPVRQQIRRQPLCPGHSFTDHLAVLLRIKSHR